MIEGSHKKEGHATTKVVLATGQHQFKRELEEMRSSTDGGIEVLGEARDEEEAVKLTREMKPDMVVLVAEGPPMVKRKAVEQMLEASSSRGWSSARGMTPLASYGSSWPRSRVLTWMGTPRPGTW